MPRASQTGITFENGVANGVVYLNASKTTTQSGNLTYNGSLLTIIGAAGVRTQAAATQDAIALAGRAGGTGGFVTTLTPGTMTASVTHTLPIVSGTLATLANTPQTFAGSVTINGTLTVGGDSVNHNIGNTLTTGSVTVGSPTQTGNITLGQSTAAQTVNVHTGVTATATTKTLNLGTGGASGSITNINIGSSTSGSTSNIVANGNLGLGVAPSSWPTGRPAFEMYNGALSSLGGPFGQVNLTSNAYASGSNDIGLTTWRYTRGATGDLGGAARYTMTSSTHLWYSANPGIAGDAINFTQAMMLDATGLTIGGNTAVHSGNVGTYAVPIGQKGEANGVASLDATGKVPTAQLPSYVDDVLEAENFAALPATGEAGKIYIALDTNKAYRWSGSAYVYITSGAVDSVAGRTGVVTLGKSDVGLGNVENTALSTWAGSANVTTASATLSAGGNQVLHAGNFTSYAPSASTVVMKRRARIDSSDGTNLNSSITHPETGFTYGGSGEPQGPFIAFGGLSGTIDYSMQVVGQYNGGGNHFVARTRNDDGQVWNPWRTLLTDGNYANYALPLTGGTLSGNLGINTATPSSSWSADARLAHVLSTGSTAAAVRTQSALGSCELFASGGTNEVGVYSNSEGPLSIYQNSVKQLSIGGTSFKLAPTFVELPRYGEVVFNSDYLTGGYGAAREGGYAVTRIVGGGGTSLTNPAFRVSASLNAASALAKPTQVPILTSTVSGTMSRTIIGPTTGFTTTPDVTCLVTGSFGTGGPVLTPSPTYTITNADYAIVLTGSNCTLTFPLASTQKGRMLCISNQGAFSATATTTNIMLLGSSQTPGNVILPAVSGKWAMLQSNGSNWIQIMGN